MNELIRLASKLRELKYAPDPVLYGKLLGWVNTGGLESLRAPLEHDLLRFTSEDIEVPVQRLDRALTDPPLYYRMKATDTLRDLQREFGEYENVSPEQVRFMSVGPTVEYKGQRVGGKTRRLGDGPIPLHQLRDVTLVAYPYIYPGNRYAQPINWTERLTQAVSLRYKPQIAWHDLGYSPGTTVGDLRLRLWVILQVHPYEQELTSYGNQLGDTSRKITAHLEMDLKTHLVTVHGPFNFNRQFRISINDDAEDLEDDIERRYREDVDVIDMWLGAPGDPARQRLTGESKLLYRFLLLHPDKDVYVDIEEE